MFFSYIYIYIPIFIIFVNIYIYISYISLLGLSAMRVPAKGPSNDNERWHLNSTPLRTISSITNASQQSAGGLAPHGAIRFIIRRS